MQNVCNAWCESWQFHYTARSSDSAFLSARLEMKNHLENKLKISLLKCLETINKNAQTSLGRGWQKERRKKE